MDKLVLLKIGGSFFKKDSSSCLNKLAEVISAAEEYKFAIVCGGGGAADLVRDFDSRHNLNNKTAHFAAITAMEMNSYLFADFFNNYSFFSTEFDLKNSINIFLPLNYYKKFNPLPQSWQVTSDSIALELAIRINAEKLILIKQRNYTAETLDFKINKKSFIEIKAEKINENGLVDSHFPLLFNNHKINSDIFELEAVIINGNSPRKLSAYLRGEAASITKIKK
ncbi:MAG: hypothetical protein ACLFQ4_05325 [Halanaerobium sp.]